MSTTDETEVTEVTALLDALLTAAADEGTRDHWERYLKGTARFRGVPMAGVRASVRSLWRTRRLTTWSDADLLGLAHRWFARPMSEDKIAAVLLITEHLRDRLRNDHIDALAHPLAEGWIADWNVCDWYATKALHTFLTADKAQLRPRAEAVAAWSRAPGLWQRRACVVAFVKLAGRSPHPFPGFADLLLDAAAANLVSSDRFAHTGPGWLLRELSRTAPDRVADFIEAHPELSPEAVRMAGARLRPGPYRRR
ncbi:DNA alkylation repair protein [Streptomyces sp. NPDC002845]